MLRNKIIVPGFAWCGLLVGMNRDSGACCLPWPASEVHFVRSAASTFGLEHRDLFPRGKAASDFRASIGPTVYLVRLFLLSTVAGFLLNNILHFYVYLGPI